MTSPTSRRTNERLTPHPLARWRSRSPWREAAFQLLFAALHLYGAALAVTAGAYHARAMLRALGASDERHRVCDERVRDE